MKDITIEELLDDLSSYSDVSDEYYKLKDEIVAEYMGQSSIRRLTRAGV